jgi:response regulator RpfG family c-di-GMP phosphodiesterase
MQASGFAVSEENGDYAILAGTGRYEDLVDRPMHEALDEDMLNLLIKARNTKTSFFSDNAYVGCFWTEHGSENILYIEGKRKFSQLDQDLIRIFSTNVAAAFDNLYLNKEIIDSQKEMVFTLGDVVETRSKETVRHVQRVAEYARLLGRLHGLNDDDIELLRLAAPMHDVGKIGIPDAILNKPGKLTPDEFESMKTHTTIGHDILKGSQRPIFKAAATIALQHHEHWDGQGYPRGLLEGEAHIFSRICGLVDVFDALSHKRCYKGAWGLDVIVEYFHEERGAFFDPALVDLFMAHVGDFVAIKDAHPNPE